MLAMRRTRALLLLTLLLALPLVGCSSPFPRDVPRSQYDRYAQLRGRQRGMTELDVYGREQRSLRERLRPLGEP